MSIRIRLDSDDDEDEDGGSDDSEDETRSWSLLNPPNLGGVFVRSILVFTALTGLSIVGMALELLLAADEPFVDQPHLEDPISAWAWLLSHTATAVSIFGYVAWSFRKQRQLKGRLSDRRDVNPLTKPVRVLRIVVSNDDDLDEYEKRVKLTVFAFVLGVIVGNLPVRIIFGAILS